MQFTLWCVWDVYPSVYDFISKSLDGPLLYIRAVGLYVVSIYIGQIYGSQYSQWMLVWYTSGDTVFQMSKAKRDIKHDT